MIITFNVHCLNVPKQPSKNSVDCVVYLVIFTELIIQHILKDSLLKVCNMALKLTHGIGESVLISKRAQLAFMYYNTFYMTYEKPTNKPHGLMLKQEKIFNIKPIL